MDESAEIAEKLPQLEWAVRDVNVGKPSFQVEAP
jgi:hypothetical protein